MTTELADALTLRVERVIRAPRERVFDAWTKPELMQQWSSPVGMTIPDATMDMRVGGHFAATMLEDNGTRHIVRGVYREISRPSRLVYTHAWVRDNGASNEMTPETIVTVEFREEQGATRVVLTQTGFTEARSRDGHVGGWNSSLDNLEKLFATNSTTNSGSQT